MRHRSPRPEDGARICGGAGLIGQHLGRCNDRCNDCCNDSCTRALFSLPKEALMPDPKKPQEEKAGEKFGEKQDKALDEPWDHPDQEPEKHPDLEKLREAEE